MKIRKKLLLLALIAAFSIVSAACGKSSPSTASSSADRETITGTLRTEDTAEDVNKESDEGADVSEDGLSISRSNVSEARQEVTQWISEPDM